MNYTENISVGKRRKSVFITVEKLQLDFMNFSLLVIIVISYCGLMAARVCLHFCC